MRLLLTLLWSALSASAIELAFPPGAMVNVREEGLRGDGSDQTDLFQTIISRYVGTYRHLYFPDGVYTLSRTVQWRKASGVPESGLTLIGQSREKTLIRLADSATGFGSDVGKPMLLMYSQLVHSRDGNENSAFRNSLRNLTLDIGMGNPGAIAVDYLCNNVGGIQDVTVRSRDPAGGLIGIKFDRGSPGPAYLKNLSVEGFRYGISTDHRIAGLVLENIVLTGQRTAGIRNCQNTLSIRDLRSRNKAPAIQNLRCDESSEESQAGMVVLIDGKLEGGDPGFSAIENAGSLLLRDVSASGYKSVLTNKGATVPGLSFKEFTTAWKLSRGGRSRYGLFTASTGTMRLPVAETPAYFDSDFGHWAVVTDSIYGAVPDDNREDCESIRKAIASGRSTIFFKRGVYDCREMLAIRGNVRHILGDNAWIRVREFKPGAVKTLFLLDSGARFDVRIENMDLRDDGDVNDTLTLIRHESARALTLSGVYLSCRSNALRAYAAGHGAGNLYLEDVASTGASPWRFSPGQKIWARQFDPEGFGPKLLNEGADLWILGIKSENPGPVLKATRSSRTEILGGILLPCDPVDKADPAFILEDSRASLTYAFRNANMQPGEWYVEQIRDRRGRLTRSLTWDSVITPKGSPQRHLHVPLYSN